jgi:hypothetical protein
LDDEGSPPVDHERLDGKPLVVVKRRWAPDEEL